MAVISHLEITNRIGGGTPDFDRSVGRRNRCCCFIAPIVRRCECAGEKNSTPSSAGFDFVTLF